MRDELRRIIIPLLQKCMNEKPQDLITFCSRYFQSLLDSRNSSILSETASSSDERLKSTCEESIENKPTLQGSSSLPILNEDVSAKGLQLRETTSWNDSSSFRQTSTQPQKMHFSVTDPGIQIGDQLKVTGGCIGVEIGKIIGEGCKSEVGESPILNTEKNEENSNYVPENNVKSTKIINTSMTPYSSIELENEFDKLMNLAEVSFRPKTPASTRKKWKIEDDAHWQLDRKFKLHERGSVDSDADADSHTFKEERDETTTSPRDASPENTLLNTSFGFIPKLVTDLEKLEIPRDVASGIDVGDIEGLVKSVSRALQELIHVLCASRLYFDDKLEKVMQIRRGRNGPKVVEKPQIPPRKKRSATTFPVSDARPPNRKNTRRLNKEEYKAVTNCVKEMHSLEEDIRVKVEKRSQSTGYLEDGSIDEDIKRFPKPKKYNNDVNQKFSATSEGVKENIQMEHGKEIRDALPQLKKNDDASIKPQIDKFEEQGTVNANISEQDKSKPHKSGVSECKAGISSEIGLPGETVQRRSWSKRRNSNHNYHDSHPHSQFENSHQQHPRQTRRPNDCKSFNIPHGAGTKNRGRGFNNRPPRFRGFRGEQISIRQRSGTFNFLEGGDVLPETTNTQRSIGTETDFSQVRERSKNSNAIPKLETNSSSFKESVASGKVDGHCIKVQEINFIGNETIKKNILASAKGAASGSVCQHKEPKFIKSIDRASKPTDKPMGMSSKLIETPIEKPEPKSDTPKQNPLKDAPDITKKNLQLEDKRVISLSRPISNSSLNPAAKSFNPSNFMKTKGNSNSPVKSPGNPIFSGRERCTMETTDTSSLSKDSELSSKKTYRFATDWAIESSEFASEEDGIANNLNARNIENGRSDVKNPEVRHGFNSRTHESDQETNIPNSIMNGSANRSANESFFQRRMNGAFKNDKQPPKNKDNNKKPCSHSDSKIDEATYSNDEPEQAHENTSSKQELVMGSASGDFVVTDGGDIAQHPSERPEGVIPSSNANVEVRLPPSINAQDESVPGSQNPAPKEEPGLSSACGDFGPIEGGIAQPIPGVQEGVIPRSNPADQELRFSFTMDLQNRDVSGSAQGIGHQSADRVEEIELNFACLSDSETSELYSDLSEEYSYDGNNAEQDL